MPKTKKGWSKRRPITGTKSTNGCRACFNTDTLIQLEWESGGKYPAQPVLLSPVFQWFVEPENQSYMGLDNIYQLSAMQNWDFRKMLTMYQQIRVDGVYIKITPINFSSLTQPYVTFYTLWDRKANGNTVNTWGTQSAWGTTNQDVARRIKETCQAQNGRGRTFAPGKGGLYFKTGCHARTTSEKAFLDAEAQTSSKSKTVSPGTMSVTGLGIKKYQFETTSDLSWQPFSPACWITAELPDFSSGPTFIVCKFEMRTYVTFRSPGNIQGPSKSTTLLYPTSNLLPSWSGRAPEEEKKTEEAAKPSVILDEDTKMD